MGCTHSRLHESVEAEEPLFIVPIEGDAGSGDRASSPDSEATSQNEYRRLNCNCRSLVFEVTAPKVALRGSTVAVFQLGWLVQL